MHCLNFFRVCYGTVPGRRRTRARTSGTRQTGRWQKECSKLHRLSCYENLLFVMKQCRFTNFDNKILRIRILVFFALQDVPTKLGRITVPRLDTQQ